MTPFVDLHTHKVLTDDDVVSVVSLSVSENPCGNGLFSIGIHPWTLDDERFDKETAFAELERKKSDPRVVAIGETGLDRLYPDTMEKQIALFERHVALSERTLLPIIIHNVRCTAEFIALRKRLKPKQRWIIHGFAGGVEEAEQLINQDFLLSIGAALLDEKRKISKALKDIDLSYVFFETDTAEVSVKTVYERAAELLQMPIESLKENTYSRFCEFITRQCSF